MKFSIRFRSNLKYKNIKISTKIPIYEILELILKIYIFIKSLEIFIRANFASNVFFFYY